MTKVYLGGLDLSFMKTPENQEFLARARKEQEVKRRAARTECKRSDISFPYYLPPLKEFVSHVGAAPEIISSRKQLKDHERAYEVVQCGDSRTGEIVKQNEKKTAALTEQAKGVDIQWS